MSQINESTSTQPPAWKSTVGYLAGAFLGLILLVGAFSKVIDPVAFQETIKNEGLDFLLPASVVAMIGFALEVGLGSALVLGIRRLWVLIPSAGLVAFFLFLTGRAYYRFSNGLIDEGEGCGCFGSLVERTPAEAFWQDTLLMVPALLLAWLGWRATRAMPLARLATVLVLTAGTLGFAAKAPTLPIDDLATRLKPGKTVSDFCTGNGDERLCLGTIIPELEEGEHLVVITDLSEGFGAAVPSLNEVTLSGDSLVVVSSVEAEAHHTFFWSYGPAFQVREAPEALLKPLYRTLPRSFRLVDGTVTETWAGLPPLPPPSAPPLPSAPEAAEASSF